MPGGDFIEINEVLTLESVETSIKHKPGQVILLDFWATWCPPCQAPMAHNQHMLEEHAAEWGDKVRIIGISIDKGVEVVEKHVKVKGWEKVEHYHRGGSTASEDYGVEGVPHVVLIDTNGKLAYIGHPATRKLDQDIATLLKGEKLTGEGVGPGGEDEDEDKGEYKDLDLAAVRVEMDKWEKEVICLSKNSELQKSAGDLARDFVVLLRMSKYNGDKKKYLTKYENINVLVGPQASIDKVLPLVKDFVTKFNGSFTSSDRIQAM